MAKKSDPKREPKILIADDHRMTRHMIRNILEQDGMIVEEAQDGAEALRIYKEFNPDMILLDIMMPVMDGLETCARIKETPEGRYTPVLIFTAPESGKIIDQAFLAGAADFVSKPVNIEELRHRVKRLLYLRGLEVEGQKNIKDLNASYKRIKSLSTKILQAHEDERLRLARELHDELGMTLTTFKLNLQILNSGLVSPEDSGLKNNLQSILQQLDDSLTMVRSKSIDMRPPSLDNLGLVHALENMLHNIEMNTDMKTHLDIDGAPGILPVEVLTTIYRCVQEAITNAARHSSAKNLTVSVKFSEDEVFLSIVDDGVGFNVTEMSHDGVHLGLQGMEERVDLLNGEISIKSHEGQGTTIEITIPNTGL